MSLLETLRPVDEVEASRVFRPGAARSFGDLATDSREKVMPTMFRNMVFPGLFQASPHAAANQFSFELLGGHSIRVFAHREKRGDISREWRMCFQYSRIPMGGNYIPGPYLGLSHIPLPLKNKEKMPADWRDLARMVGWDVSFSPKTNPVHSLDSLDVH